MNTSSGTELVVVVLSVSTGVNDGTKCDYNLHLEQMSRWLKTAW